MIKYSSYELKHLVKQNKYLFHVTNVYGFIQMVSGGYVKPLTVSGEDGRGIGTASFTEDPIALIEDEPLTFARRTNPKDFILIFSRSDLEKLGVRPVKYVPKGSAEYDKDDYTVMLDDFEYEREWRSLESVPISLIYKDYAVVNFVYSNHDMCVKVI